MYVKLFGTILDSSIWLEDTDTRILWVTMLAMADAEGYVYASEGGLAHRAVLPIDATRRALAKLESPDPDSRSSDHEGRRVQRVEGGWMLLNYKRYREMRTPEQVREATKKRRQRSAGTRPRQAGHEGTVRDNGAQVPMSPLEAEADVEAVSSERSSLGDASRNSDIVGHRTEPLVSAAAMTAFAELWKLYPKRAGTNSRADALKQFKARVAEGVSVAVMWAGVARYRRWCEATGKIGTETVMQAQRFLGRGQHFLEPYDLPVTALLPPKQPKSFEQQRREVNEQAAEKRRRWGLVEAYRASTEEGEAWWETVKLAHQRDSGGRDLTDFAYDMLPEKAR